jgi:hypothetical protein
MKRMNFRVDDSIRGSLEELVCELNKAGEDSSMSEVARLVMREGLKSLKDKTQQTSAGKGFRFERWVQKQLAEALPEYEFQRLQPEQGKRNPDILGPFCAYECKTGKRPSTRGALEQAVNSDRGELEPVGVIRDDSGHAFVVLKLESFLKFLKAFGLLRKFAARADE